MSLNRTTKLLILGRFAIVFLLLIPSLVSATPDIEFVPPTPDDNNWTGETFVTVNVSVTDDTSYTSTFIDWDESLIAYWNFEDIDGANLYDNSTHSNTGTLGGGLGDQDIITGKFGSALHFNGTSDYVNCGSTADGDYDEMTIELWMRMTSTSPSGWRTALHRNDGTTVGSSVFFIGLEATTHDIVATIGAGSYTGAGDGYQAGNTNIPAVLNQWYHVACSWDGTTGRVYIDGVKEKEYGLTSLEFSNKVAVTRLCASSDGGGYLFAGDVDEVRIWNRSLSTDEIDASFNSSVINHLSNTFTELETYNYSYYGHTMNIDGYEDTTATRHIDVSPDEDAPISSVDSVSPYNQITSPLTITATATDVSSAVENVTLYYRQSTDNTTWASGMENWWNGGWNYRKLITVDPTQIYSTLTNFPILVSEAADNSLLANAQPNGDDIAFVSYSDNSTQYNHDLEYYDSSDGEVAAWVNITSLSSTTKIWMYYGNGGCGSQQNKYGTWDSSFTQILHLNETDIDNGVGDIKDATGNINATTKNMEVADHITGQIAGAMTFDGSNEYIDTAYTDSISSGSYTLNVWVNNIPSGSKYVVCQHDASYSSDFILGYQNGGFWGDSAVRDGSGTISTAGWHQLGFTITTGSPCTSKLYIDGNVVGASIAGPVPPSLGQSTKLMARGDGAGSYCSGNMDEYRVSNVIRSDDWIRTEYATIKNQSTFISIGEEEGGGWELYTGDTNPDLASPWSWSFNFPDGTGYYEFYSTSYDERDNLESTPGVADAICHYGNVYAKASCIVKCTEYSPNEDGTIYVQILYGNGTSANSSIVKANIWLRSIKIFDSVTMEYISGSMGIYYYSFSAPSSIGVYVVGVRSTNPTSYGLGEFHVSQWSQDISNINDTVDYINNTINSNILSYLNDINNTINSNANLLTNINVNTTSILANWGSQTAQALYNLESETKNISTYINDTMWTNFTELIDKWGAYTASSLYSVSEQAKNIVQYINDTRWDTYFAATLYSKSNSIENIASYINNTRWDTKNAQDLYDISDEIKTIASYISNVVDYINNTLVTKWAGYTVEDIYSIINYINATRWDTFTAQQLYNKADEIYDITEYINTSRWGMYNVASLYSLSDEIKDIADYINNTRWNTYTARILYDMLDAIDNTLTKTNETVTNINNTETPSSGGFFRVLLSNFGEITPGSDYKAQLLVFNETGCMIDADALPLITLYDSNGNAVVTNAQMTNVETGRYSYSYTTSSGQPSGQWMTLSSTVIASNTVKNVVYWELESNPPEVTLIVTDTTITGIQADLAITNEGSSSQEYIYYYWITPRVDGDIADPDTIDVGSASKLINPSETYVASVSLSLSSIGDYYFKARVYYGTEYSSALRQFTSTSEPSGGTGGSGGGGVTSVIVSFSIDIPTVLLTIKDQANNEIFSGMIIAGSSVRLPTGTYTFIFTAENYDTLTITKTITTSDMIEAKLEKQINLFFYLIIAIAIVSVITIYFAYKKYYLYA